MVDQIPKPPEILNRIVRTVLAYHPKPKSQPAKKRHRLASKAHRPAQSSDKKPADGRGFGESSM